MIRVTWCDMVVECETVDEAVSIIKVVKKRDNDWIEWDGGERPVDGHVRVDVKYRNGDVELSEPARRFTREWLHVSGYDFYDIVAYRIASND